MTTPHPIASDAEIATDYQIAGMKTAIAVSHEVTMKSDALQLFLNRLTTAERERDEALRQEVQHQEKRVVTYRGHITRIKNRIHAGVCIHCNRTFSDLARHMKCKHDEVLA